MKPVFERWGELHPQCPSCEFGFEREPGYWVGAMIINTTVTFVLFLVTLVGGMVIFWPEVPWMSVFVTTVVVTLATPILFYPHSKTLWAAVELSYHPPEQHELG